MLTYEILENGHQFATVRARSPENAIRAARRGVTIYASDYNVDRGAIVELRWTARALDGDGYGNHTATITLTARAK